MASKIGIGIGVKIDDIKKVKDDLTKQIGNIKGLKAKVSNIEIDNEKIKSQIESKFKSISKDLKIKLKGIEIEDNVKQKITNQIQRVLNSLGKDISIKVKDIELADSLKSKMQSKLNQALKGVTVKIANVEFDVTKVDTLVRKTKKAQQEIKQMQTITEKSLNIGDGAKSFAELQRRAKQIRREVDSLAKISFTTDKKGGIDKAMITYTDSLGKVVTETMGWKQVTSQTEGVVKNVFTTLSTKVNENIAGFKNLEQQVASTKAQLQRQLNVAKAMGMNESVINSLQAKLNSLNVNNFKQNIAGVKQAFRDLGVNSVNNVNKLQNAINTLENRLNYIKNTKMDIIKSNDITELREVQNQLQHLKNLMSQVKSGKIIDGKIISSEINTARNSMQQLNNSIRQATASGTSLKTVMGNIMSYTLGGGVTFFALNQLRDGLKTITDIDSAMRDLKRVTDDVSESTLNNFSSKANEMAKELGSTTEEAIKATTVWKQMGYSFNEASQFLAKQSMTLGNVGDMSSKDASNALVSTMKAFKIEAKDTEMIVDSLNEAGNKFAITTGDLAEGLRVGASSLALANNDLYQSEALIVAGTEVLRDANSVANGLKTISMRLNEVKTADGDTFYKLKNELQKLAGVDLTDVNGNLRSTYDVVLDLAEVWNSGKLDDMSKAQLLNDIAGKHQAKVLSAIIQNAEQLPKIYDAMKNSAGSAAEEQARYMDSIEGKINALKETSKSLWINMIDANSVKGLIDGATSIVGVFDTIMKKVGAFPTVITTVVGALTIFNSKFREMTSCFQTTKITNYINRMNDMSDTFKMSKQRILENILAQKQHILTQQETGMAFITSRAKLIQYQTQLGLATVAQNALTIGAKALGAAMNMAFGIGIGFIIQGIMNFANASEIAKQKNEALLSSIQEVKSSISTMSELSAQAESLSVALAKGNLTESETVEKKKQLNDVYNQLIQACPQLEGALSLENEKYEDNIELIKQAINLKKEQLKLDIQKYLTNNDVNDKGIQKQIDGIKTLTSEIKSFAENSLMTDDQLVDSGNMTIFGKMFGSGDDRRKYFEQLKNESKQELLDLQSDLQDKLSKINTAKSLDIPINVSPEYKEQLEQAISEINTYLTNGVQKLNINTNEIKLSTEAINSLKQAQQELSDTGVVTNDSIDKLNQTCPELKINAENVSEVLGLMKDTMDGLEDSSDNVNQSVDSLSSLSAATKDYVEASQQMASIKDIIDSINESQQITPDLQKKIIDSFPDVGTAILDVGSCVDFLNEKMGSMADAQSEALAIMIGDDATFYQEKIANNSSYENYINGFLQRFVGNSNDNYNIDLSNYETLNQMKSSAMDSLGSAVDSWMSKYIDVTSSGYQVDYKNFQTLIGAKAEILKSFAGSLAQFWDDTSESFSQQAYGGIDLSGGQSSEYYDKYTQKAQGILDIQSKIRAAYDDLENIYTGGGLNLNKGLSSSFGSGGTIGSSGTGGSKGSSGSKGGSSGSSGKSEAEKAAEEAEKYAEKIRDLNSSLDIDRYFDANTAISKLENAMTDLKNSQDTLIGADLGKAKRQETEIIKQQIKAYQDLIEIQKGEQAELKATLQANGFYIDSNGKLYDSQQRLNQLQDELNAKSYASSEEGYKQKQKDIEALKELQKQVERYVEISVDDIPKATQKWNELSNSMRKTALSNLENLRDKLVDGLEKQYEDKKDKELTKIDEAYEKRKERLEKQYQKDVDSLTREKEKALDFYQAQIDELQKQLDDLEDDSKDKQEKLAKLKQQLALWQQDDSVFAKKKIEDLNKEIADLEKEILKDSLKDQIDNLKDKKDEKENYYDESLQDLKDAHEKELEEINKKYEREKKEAEEKYEKLLSDKKLYAEANKLITEQNLEEIQQILRDSAEDFKEIGALLGQNFADSLREEVQTALNDFRTLTGQATVDYDWKNGDNGDKYAEKVGGFVGTTSKGNSFTYDPKGGIMSPNPLTPEEIQEIRELAKKKGISAFDTGGRTPSTIGNAGALAILHKNEKILNPEDTKMLDRIYGYVKEANSHMGYMYEAFNQFKQMSDYITGISGNRNTSIKRESINDNSKQVNLENNFNINNYTKSDSTFSKRELERFAIKQAKLYK